MKLYLSSYKLGNDTEGLKRLVGKTNARVAVIDNAKDYSNDADFKSMRLQQEIESMRLLGFEPEHLDLKEFFGKSQELVDLLTGFDVVWVTGGNVFILRKAMEMSGFDAVFKQLVLSDELVYAGYSAGICVLAPSLRGMELVDEPDLQIDGYIEDTIWSGYGLINFYPLVHYKSDHPESHLVDMELKHIQSLGIKYRTLRDGDVMIVNSLAGES